MDVDLNGRPFLLKRNKPRDKTLYFLTSPMPFKDCKDCHAITTKNAKPRSSFLVYFMQPSMVIEGGNGDGNPETRKYSRRVEKSYVGLLQTKSRDEGNTGIQSIRYLDAQPTLTRSTS